MNVLKYSLPAKAKAKAKAEEDTRKQKGMQDLIGLLILTFSQTFKQGLPS
jgi:hypothetical protein